MTLVGIPSGPAPERQNTAGSDGDKVSAASVTWHGVDVNANGLHRIVSPMQESQARQDVTPRLSGELKVSGRRWVHPWLL